MDILLKLLPYLIVGTSSMILLQSNRNADAAKLLRSCSDELLHKKPSYDRARCLKKQIDLFGQRYNLNSLAILSSLISISFLLVALTLLLTEHPEAVLVFFVLWFILFLSGVILTITSFIRARETLKQEIEFSDRFYDDTYCNNKANISTWNEKKEHDKQKELKSQEISGTESGIVNPKSVNKVDESIS